MIRSPGIQSFEFFNFVSQFGSVYYAVWTMQTVMVRFLSKEHTDRCFDKVVGKGYDAAIVVVGALFDRGLR